MPIPNPPFFNNRVTNGLTLVDLVAESLGLNADPSLHLLGPAVGTNYAVAGARTIGFTAVDLPVQVGAFAANVGGSTPTDALYVIFIGGNDVRNARDTQDPNTAKQIINLAVQGNGVRLISRRIIYSSSPLLVEPRSRKELIFYR